MPRPKSSPAKLTAPRPKKPLLREQLFKRLDEGGPVTWIQGPPGAGKTTLVASYLQHRGIKSLWYHVDSEDSEPSTFFHFLAEAAGNSGSRRVALPAIGMETRLNWLEFAKRFAHALASVLPAKSALVFDNVHEGGPLFDSILAVMIGELAEHHPLILISFHAAPASLANAQVEGNLSVVTNEALRFNAAETEKFIELSGLSKDVNLQQVEATVGGWAAGIVLLAYQRNAGHTDDAGGQPATEVLDYLARNLLAWMPARIRHIVERCAFFQEFDVGLACAASGDPAAGEQIAQLYRDGFFVEQHGTGKSVSYRLHSLLAEALRNNIGVMGSEGRELAELQAGRALILSGQTEPGIALLLRTNAFAEAAPALISVARDMLATGREEQLATWIAMLPAAIRTEQPWLEYWRATALAAFDEHAARAIFAGVYDQFRTQMDRRGMILTAAAILTASALNNNWQSFEGIEKWVSAFRDVWDPLFPLGDAESAMRAVTGFLMAAEYDSVIYAQMDEMLERLPKLMQANDDPNLLLQVGVQVLGHLHVQRGYARGLDLIDLLEKHIDVFAAKPLRIGDWLAAKAYFYGQGGAALDRPDISALADQCRKQANEVASRYQLLSMKIFLTHTEADAALAKRDLVTAGQLLESTRAMLLPSMHWQLAWQGSRQARLKLLLGRPREAWDDIQKAIEFARSAHVQSNAYAPYFQTAAICMAWLERYDEALELLKKVLELGRTGMTKVAVVTMAMFQALRAIQLKDRDVEERIQGFFLVLHNERILEFGNLMQPLLAQLCGEAIKREIELDIVTELILRRKLLPPPHPPRNWPWPVRIEALGGFRVYLWGQLLSFERKSQRKPIELLKFIVASTNALRPNEGPRNESVVGELWASENAADPKGSFDITIHRLRKLLLADDAIMMTDGCVRLNRNIVWCDAFAFEFAAHRAIQSGSRNGGESAGDVAGESPIESALALYGGPIFGAGEEAQWAFPAIERLSSRFLLLIERQGAYLESKGDLTAAVDVYERGIAQDNLVEPFYRGLMRCHIALKAPAEALRAYNRCRDLLSIVLALKPSVETEALRAQLAPTVK